MIKTLIRSVVPDSWYKRSLQVYWRLWDLWHGVETSRSADISTLNVVGRNRAYAVNYEAIGSAVRQIIKELPIDHEHFGFVDFGSGKGRVLLQASEFPFRSIEGVEFCVELHRIAESNIRRFRFAKRRCFAVRSTLADATEFALPALPLVIYMFNPFSGPVLTSVIDNIQRSAAAHPRDLLLICTGSARPRDVFENMPNVQIVWKRWDSTVYRLPSGHL